MGDSIFIPEGLVGTPVATPVADQLLERLAPVVAHLEARTVDGRHPIAARMARGIVAVRRCEAVLQGLYPQESSEGIARAKRIVAFARQQLENRDTYDALRQMVRFLAVNPRSEDRRN
jgi:hypothetical protein